ELVRMNTGRVQGYSRTNGGSTMPGGMTHGGGGMPVGGMMPGGSMMPGSGMMMMHYYLAEATAFNARDRQHSDDNIDLTALARYTPDPDVTLEAGIARKVRSPNLYERYAWSTSGMSMLMVNLAGDGNGYVGTIDL